MIAYIDLLESFIKICLRLFQYLIKTVINEYLFNIDVYIPREKLLCFVFHKDCQPKQKIKSVPANIIIIVIIMIVIISSSSIVTFIALQSERLLPSKSYKG